jgi:hypothetical protein
VLPLQTSDLLAKTEANKALNDKKRLATSYSNFARRCLLDGAIDSSALRALQLA